MEEIKKKLEEYKTKLEESSKKKYEQFRIYTNSEKEYKEYSKKCDNLKMCIDELENRLTNKTLGDIIGKFVLYKSYREDTKLGSITIGKITSIRVGGNTLDYEGISLYYKGDEFDTNGELNIRQIEYNTKLNERNSWISISNFESGLYKIITKEKYINYIEKITKLISNYTNGFIYSA